MSQPSQTRNYLTLDLSRNIYKALEASQLKYFSQRQLSTIVPNLACFYGDLSTDPVDKRQSFFQPICPKQAYEQVISSAQRHDEFSQAGKAQNGYLTAMFRVLEIEDLLAGRASKNSWNPDDEPMPEGPIDKYWESDALEMSDKTFRRIKGKLHASLHYSYKPKDEARAHVQSWLASGGSLPDEDCTRGELAALVTMTIARLSTKEFEDHRISPVLLGSSAKNGYRIIVGLIDGGGRAIYIFKSSVWKFGPTLISEENTSSLCSVLGWHLSEPVGNTL
ncbi:hypothetical protein GGR53DRAFT_279586 [Hypoxylon sp. FL1150]|nr:hypothetical protein GGR53DRAFT_279586 [Hypoxylon sp. FL1150]